MIVELTREHIAQLVSVGPVELDGVTVRIGDGGVLEQRTRTEQVAERRADTRAKLTGTDPQFYMRAKYDGVCYAQYSPPHAPDCTQQIATGDRVLRDRENGKTYCANCGAARFPNVPVRRQ